MRFHKFGQGESATATPMVRIFDFSKELRDVNPKALRIEK
jgi:hypothetical protein